MRELAQPSIYAERLIKRLGRFTVTVKLVEPIFIKIMLKERENEKFINSSILTL